METASSPSPRLLMYFNIEILNQSAIFKYIEEEFSVKAKVSEINEVYKSLLSS